MGIFFDPESGSGYLTQGDSGEVVFSGLPVDKNYQVYFAVHDSKRNLIGAELTVNSNKSDTVKFTLIGEFTDLLKVPLNKESETYYYGIKLCHNDDKSEDTLIVGSKSDIETQNELVVYPKKVEGIL